MLCFPVSFVLIYRMEKERFKTEVSPLQKKLAGYARRLLDNPQDVEDAIQEVFLKLWNIRRELDRYHSVEALAIRMTRNVCLNRLNASRLHGEVPLSDSVSQLSCEENPYMILEKKDEINHLEHIMGKLSGLQQVILRMKHVDGLEIREIAELTGSTPENVRVNLSRARKKVKELFLKI